MIKIIKLLFLAAALMFSTLGGLWWVVAGYSLFFAFMFHLAETGKEVIFGSEIFAIDGYFKKSMTMFEGELVVPEKKEEIDPDADVFYFELSEIRIQDAIKNGDDLLPFVITSYKKIH